MAETEKPKNHLANSVAVFFTLIIAVAVVVGLGTLFYGNPAEWTDANKGLSIFGLIILWFALIEIV